VELGGSDQKFNLLMGRQLQREYGQPSQIVLTMPLLEGIDGVQKMSKSYDNYIGITEPPLEMYGKVMSISDQLMWRYYELLTDVSTAEIEKMRSQAESGAVNPMQFKKDLAQRIVADFHGKDAAQRAGEDWAKQFQRDEVPEEVEEVSVSLSDVSGIVQSRSDSGSGGGYPIKLDRLLARSGLVGSVSEGGRKLKEKAVRVNDVVVTDPIFHLGTLSPPFPMLIVRVGRKLRKVRISSHGAALTS